MKDRELLEMAAKAASIPIIDCSCSDAKWPFKHNESVSGKHGHWSPLESDGDALRLAVKLNLQIDRSKNGDIVYASEWHDGAFFEYVSNQNDMYSATRRVITRVAAEIGKRMP